MLSKLRECMGGSACRQVKQRCSECGGCRKVEVQMRVTVLELPEKKEKIENPISVRS